MIIHKSGMNGIYFVNLGFLSMHTSMQAVVVNTLLPVCHHGENSTPSAPRLHLCHLINWFTLIYDNIDTTFVDKILSMVCELGWIILGP